ncbi:MAG TPA: phosphotransferase [Kribbellaceae bacterium]|nr:phosphotransferase [Kribbellaceae bacterium]
MAEWDAVGASAVPLAGGYGGETFAATAAGEDAVLRLYLRSPQRARIDVALTELVRGLLPVPRVLDAKPDGTADDPPYVLSERLPGVSLETFLPTADTAQRRRVGEQLGDLLATLSGIPFPAGRDVPRRRPHRSRPTTCRLARPAPGRAHAGADHQPVRRAGRGRRARRRDGPFSARHDFVRTTVEQRRDRAGEGTDLRCSPRGTRRQR